MIQNGHPANYASLTDATLVHRIAKPCVGYERSDRSFSCRGSNVVKALLLLPSGSFAHVVAKDWFLGRHAVAIEFSLDNAYCIDFAY